MRGLQMAYFVSLQWKRNNKHFSLDDIDHYHRRMEEIYRVVHLMRLHEHTLVLSYVLFSRYQR